MITPFCPHCRRGFTALQLAFTMTTVSAIIGLFAGLNAGYPTEGAAFGLLHAVVPVGWMIEEAFA